MKTISTNLMAHIHQDVTTIASCWLITRTDGKVFAFTDHDSDLTVNGVTYRASSGYLRSALKSDQTLSVDNMDITGILNSDAITDADLKAGKFDYAQVQLFIVNWADLTQGILKMRSGTFGESVRNPTGTFRAELRGLTQALVQDVNQTYMPVCRADLGDSRCKVPIAPSAWTAGTVVTVGTYVSDPNPSDDAHTLAIYQCTTAGTTAGTAPAFSPTVGATTTETTGVVWTSMKPYRGVATVASASAKNSFVASGISVPSTPDGDIASVTFTQKANLVGYTIVLTVGAQTVSYHIPTTYNTTDQVKWLANSINQSYAAGQIAAKANMVFSATNDHSVVITKVTASDSGSVTVQDDILNQVRIVNFGGANGIGTPSMQGGLVYWVTGANAGLSMEMKDYTPSTGVLNLYLNMPFTISAGDKFYYTPGCDKSRSTCYLLYNNILNFRGEPDVPGTDVMFTYPDAVS